MVVHIADTSTKIHVTRDKSNTLINSKTKNDSDNDNQSDTHHILYCIRKCQYDQSQRVMLECLHPPNGTINAACV